MLVTAPAVWTTACIDEQEHRARERVHAVDEGNEQNEAELAADARRDAHEDADQHPDHHQHDDVGRRQKTDESGNGDFETHGCIPIS